MHVRVRPLNDAEKERGNAWRVEGNSLFHVDAATGAAHSDAAPPYKLDTVFDSGSSTAQVYEATTRDLIHQVVGGFNSTVFAYGQTSSGKTHTMRGTDGDPGIVPRAVHEIFDLINATQDREFLLRVSYMEVRPRIIERAPCCLACSSCLACRTSSAWTPSLTTT